MSELVRWGIAGLGNIASKFAEDLELVKGGELAGVASRSLEKAEEFGKKFNASHCFGSYEEMFKSDKVDAIYIATPHTSHEALAVQAMEHGKHVLCEKPFGINSAEVQAMIAASERNNVFLMEAMWSRFNPSIRKVKALVDSGDLGAIRYLHADFAFYALNKAEDGRLLNPELAGGSLLDIGIYPIFLAYLMLGRPKSIQAVSQFYHTGVEIQTSMIFDYEKAQALLFSGLNSKSEMKAEISCEQGSVFIHPRWHETQGFSVEQGEEMKHFDLPTLGRGYSHEIEEVHSCLAKGATQSSLWSHQNSIDLMQLLDTVRQKSGIRFPAES
ncbi:Gfo/Idh/MocA family protein [Poritiphilus flavus]|uniref:Gfo/Idh/MocA family oxidoreductase n=1 Tax=Poritiphilus flavus TaxID=2697053 RepID=A0A6L9EFB3_9FLAO|nr:Gfo/Idh/MocA family oxidoreductase [Poritiphilus flavus]NAS13460.1 Gfo/Idh/MocA family oxidoreductase [Poritiphilus flavus]